MDETKNLSETEGSQPPVEGSGGSSDETKSLSETEGPQPPVEGSGGSTLGDPTKIGRYRIIRRLGSGRVRTGLSCSRRRPRPPRCDQGAEPRTNLTPRGCRGYLNEARILARLDHPNIVPVYDVGRTDDGLCFVVSKLIEGSDLAARIKERLAPASRIRRNWSPPIAEALHYAHTRGLVHRDIKPANILIDASGKPCVADFGLALKDEDFGKGGGLAGTPRT